MARNKKSLWATCGVSILILMKNIKYLILCHRWLLLVYTKDQFYSQLLVLLSIKPKQQIIFAGDLNARASWQSTVDEPCGENIINNSGERLIELELHGLKISNTLFPHKSIHKNMWKRLSLELSLVYCRLHNRQSDH